MMIRKRYVVIPLLAFCLTATLFIATVTSGKKENPWDIISELQTKVEALESRVETLEGQLLPQGFLTAPAYDSGWVDITPAWHYFEHSLGTTEVLVYLQGRYWRDGAPSIENHGEFAWEWLNATGIWVNAGVDVDQIRVLIWKISEP